MIGLHISPTPDFGAILDNANPWILSKHVRADHAESVSTYHRDKKYDVKNQNRRHRRRVLSCRWAGLFKPTYQVHLSTFLF
jgi:hypothetical protein